MYVNHVNKPCKSWDQLCVSTGAGFLPSAELNFEFVQTSVCYIEEGTRPKKINWDENWNSKDRGVSWFDVTEYLNTLLSNFFQQKNLQSQFSDPLPMNQYRGLRWVEQNPGLTLHMCFFPSTFFWWIALGLMVWQTSVKKIQKYSEWWCYGISTRCEDE